MGKGTLAWCAAILLAGCAGPGRLPQWQGSANFDERHPVLVVIHHTGDANLDKARATLTDPAMKVSAHYLLGRDGSVQQLVAEEARAWHAGAARWGVVEDVNSASIGIELDNDGNEPFAAEQIARLLVLLDELKTRHHLPAAAFVGHADVAPKRKSDPSRYFPWRRLAQAGFGLWCDAPPVDAGADARTEATADDLLKLRALGYDISDGPAAIRAFRRHYLQDDGPAQVGQRERQLLVCLLQLAPK